MKVSGCGLYIRFIFKYKFMFDFNFPKADGYYRNFYNILFSKEDCIWFGKTSEGEE